MKWASNKQIINMINIRHKCPFMDTISTIVIKNEMMTCPFTKLLRNLLRTNSYPLTYKVKGVDLNLA